MRNTIATLVSFVLLTMFGATSALAGGTSVYNSYTDTNEWGSRDTDIQVEQYNVDVSTVDSSSLKLESNGGRTNTADLSFDGTDFDGSATATLGAGETVSIGTFVQDNTVSVSEETVNVNTTEHVRFDSSDYTHTVGNSF